MRNELSGIRTNPMRRVLQSASRDGGFSMVELIVAMVILLYVSLALMQTALINIEINTRNAVRDEAVRLASANVDFLRNVSYDDVDDYDGTAGPQPRQIRNFDMTYTVTNSVTAVNTGTTDKIYRLNVKVEWTWKGETFNTAISTVRSQ